MLRLHAALKLGDNFHAWPVLEALHSWLRTSLGGFPHRSKVTLGMHLRDCQTDKKTSLSSASGHCSRRCGVCSFRVCCRAFGFVQTCRCLWPFACKGFRKVFKALESALHQALFVYIESYTTAFSTADPPSVHLAPLPEPRQPPRALYVSDAGGGVSG